MMKTKNKSIIIGIFLLFLYNVPALAESNSIKAFNKGEIYQYFLYGNGNPKVETSDEYKLSDLFGNEALKNAMSLNNDRRDLGFMQLFFLQEPKPSNKLGLIGIEYATTDRVGIGISVQNSVSVYDVPKFYGTIKYFMISMAETGSICYGPSMCLNNQPFLYEYTSLLSDTRSNRLMTSLNINISVHILSLSFLDHYIKMRYGFDLRNGSHYNNVGASLGIRYYTDQDIFLLFEFYMQQFKPISISGSNYKFDIFGLSFGVGHRIR